MKKLEFLDRLRRCFAWDNDEYEDFEEEPEKASIPAEFPGIILDQEDNGDAIPEEEDKTEEEMVQRAARTTGVRTQGPGNGALTGVEGDGMLHISQQDLDVLTGIDEDPDAVDPEESDADNEGVELNLPVAQDPQGQFTHV